jgi:hypothetical protein
VEKSESGLGVYTMTSYLLSWLPRPSSSDIPSSTHISDVPVLEISPPPSDDDDDQNEDDRPPIFPSLSSAQRISSPRTMTDSDLMPPPPVPHLAARQPDTDPKSSSLSIGRTTIPKKRGKVALAPGHSPLDWANLKTSGEDLRVRVD